MERLIVASISVLLVLQCLATPATAAAPRRATRTALTTLLANASTDLLMPSESDFPFTPFTWTNGARATCTSRWLLKRTGHAPDTPVEVVDLEYFFRNVAQPQPWHDPTQAENVRKFQHLVTVLKDNLTDIHVYRVGTIRIDVYIVGRAGNDLAGLSTVVIET